MNPTQPKEKTVTHICCLKTGDRFYFINDTKKETWQLRYHTSIRIRGQFTKLSVCKNDTGDEWRYNANRVIMFLRRTIPDLPKREKEYSLDKYFA